MAGASGIHRRAGINLCTGNVQLVLEPVAEMDHRCGFHFKFQSSMRPIKVKEWRGTADPEISESDLADANLRHDARSERDWMRKVEPLDLFQKSEALDRAVWNQINENKE